MKEKYRVSGAGALPSAGKSYVGLIFNRFADAAMFAIKVVTRSSAVSGIAMSTMYMSLAGA